jgi:competence protein ComEC
MKDDFIYTGLGHMLAVSGLHVGLYAGILYFMLGFLPFKLRLPPVIIFMMVLIPFTGFKVPVLRAGLIGIFISAARFFDYETDIRKLLLFFAGIFVLISPQMVADASFLLSFSAVYGLVHLKYVKCPEWFMPVMVGLVATVAITPATALLFGTFNISSVISTIIIVPILSMQIISFIIYTFAPSISVEPLILLENAHLWIIDFFAENSGIFFTFFKADMFLVFCMSLFLIVCFKYKKVAATMVLLLIPYLPAEHKEGMYFPNMGRSKGFVVIKEKVHIFYKGDIGGFRYDFIPFLASIGVSTADEGSIYIYNGENRYINLKKESSDYGGICVNSDRDDCIGVYHTRSNSYKCDDEKIHILYKNKCKNEKTYILNETGDLYLENKSE